MKPRYYYSNSYRARIYFFIGAKPDDVVAFIKRRFKVDYDGLFEGSAKCVEVTGPKVGAIIIWTMHKKNNPKLMPDLAHECLHAANFILQARGVLPSFSNDEPQAYLLTEIMEQALGLTKQPKP